MKLPKKETTIGNTDGPDTGVQTVFTKKEAHDTVDQLIARNMELEEIYDCLQPLLYTVSLALYGEDSEPVSLSKLVDDAVKFMNGDRGTIQ